MARFLQILHWSTGWCTCMGLLCCYEIQTASAAVTFTKDVAPLIFQHCSECHRDGQTAPFSLLTYEQAKKHSPEIIKAISDRTMPPWLPERGYGDFLQSRVLSAGAIETIRKWV